MLNLFKIWSLFLCAFYVVEDGGGGSADLGDFVIDDGVETPEAATTDASKDIETPDDPPEEKPEEVETHEEKPEEKAESEEIAALKAELEALKAESEDVKTFVSQKQVEEAVQAETSKLQERYPDFDIEAVGAYLQDLAKTDKAMAESLNNPIGWENIYLKQEIENGRGEFIPARGVSKEPFNANKAMEAARSGDMQAGMALFDNIEDFKG